jgi:DNA mismatch repair ATPase MutL
MLSSVKPLTINFSAYAMSIMKLQIPVIACLLAALPAAAFADPHSDQTSSSRAAAPARSSAQPSRSYQQPSRSSAQPSRSYQQPSRSYQQPSRSYQQPSRSYQQPSRSYQQPSRSYQQQPRYTQPMPRYESRQPVSYEGSRYVGRMNVSPWGWNGGRTWIASPAYWGGGFWGAFSIGLGYGNAGYYQVAQSSPGDQLLANYGLQQTDCNQPNLVDIFGPDGSEICAFPNDQVSPGQYQVDPSTLSLVSQ